MVAASLLPWTERETLASLLEALADQFPDRHDFDVWRSGVLGAFISGAIAFLSIEEGDERVGGWLLQGGEGCWAVVATLGEPSPAAIRRAFETLKADSRVIVWDEEIGAGWVKLLRDLGARSFSRQTYVQDLTRVAFATADDDRLRIEPWGDSLWQAEALNLLAEANAWSLEGMFLTLPAAPTLERCQRAFNEVLAGAHGAFLPWASFVAIAEEQVVGALVCTQGDKPEQAVLFDLFVAPRARGMQLSRRLVMAMQGALLARGFRENRFLTMASNAPVHRLFREEEILACEEHWGGSWTRDPSVSG